jgi:hypothetical protein
VGQLLCRSAGTPPIAPNTALAFGLGLVPTAIEAALKAAGVLMAQQALRPLERPHGPRCIRSLIEIKWPKRGHAQ